MTRYRKTVEELAQENNLNTDEVLIALWDTGYPKVLRPKDRLKDINRARRALGIATRRELTSIAYWMAIFDLNEIEFNNLLHKLAVPISQMLPPKAISRLRNEAYKQGIDPFTGKAIPSSTRSHAKRETPFKLKTIGHETKLRWLNEDEVFGIHKELVYDFSKSKDPIVPAGVRSDSLLASAVFRPRTALGNILKYPTVEMSAAALLHSIILDHPFHNGNKRTALVSILVFLDENGFFPEFDQDEVFKLVLDIARHKITDPNLKDQDERDISVIAKWLSKNCRILKKGDRIISFRKLRHMLCEYDCHFDSSSGSKFNITRTITQQRIFVKKEKTLHIQIPNYSDGQNVAKDTIKKIRKQLQLDNNNGIDSQAFYSKKPLKASEFIAYYRKTLQRLAKW